MKSTRSALGTLIMLAATVGLALAQSPHSEPMHGSMSGSKYPKLDYKSLFAAATPVTGSEEGQVIIDRCLERYGGEEKLKALGSYRLTYEMDALHMNANVLLKKSFERGRHYRVYRLSPNREEVRGLNGESAWFQTPDTLMAIPPGGRFRAELYSYLAMSMPLGIKTEGFDEVRVGKREDDPLDYVYLSMGDSLLVVLGIDPEDHLIKSTEGVVAQGEKTFVFINFLSDYGEEDGYWFPHQLTHISMGLQVGKSELKDVEINVEFSKDEFQPTAPMKSGTKKETSDKTD